MAHPHPWTQRIARATIAAALLVLVAGPLMAWGLLGWQAGLGMFAMGAILGGAGGLFSLWGMITRRGNRMVAIAALTGIAAFASAAGVVSSGAGKPPINDITTDLSDPPTFKAITAEDRGVGAAPLAYDPGFASQQLAGYPDLKSLDVAETPADAFKRALAAGRRLGWDFAGGAAPAYTGDGSGQFEATATVPWWGFKDDVVIRLTPAGTGSRIDVRSKSRVGRGDLGVNAKRIEAFFAAYQAQR